MNATSRAAKLIGRLSGLTLEQQVTVGAHVAAIIDRHPTHDWDKATAEYRAASVKGWPDTVILECPGPWRVLQALAVSREGRLIRDYVHDGRAPARRQPEREATA